MQQLKFNLKGQAGDGGFHITGRTFDSKEYLKEIGAIWQPATKSWFLKNQDAYEQLKMTKPVLTARAEVVGEELGKGAKLWWFCGCEGAKIISIRSQMHSCRKCAGHRALDGEMYFVRGYLHTGD